jgi:uncharacterized membrane protein YeaQ/YmgE (transglycosylase-associated protein family)
MSILAWIILGLVSGFIANKLMNKGAGIIGALVGGFCFHLVGESGVTGFNIYSVFVSVIGSMIVIGIYHAVTRSRGTK